MSPRVKRRYPDGLRLSSKESPSLPRAKRRRVDAHQPCRFSDADVERRLAVRFSVLRHQSRSTGDGFDPRRRCSLRLKPTHPSPVT